MPNLSKKSFNGSTTEFIWFSWTKFSFFSSVDIANEKRTFRAIINDINWYAVGQEYASAIRRDKDDPTKIEIL